jgi:hypothetical protein
VRPLAGLKAACYFGLVFHNVSIVIGVPSALIYSYFSLPLMGSRGGIPPGWIGFIMVAFGARFGFTVMARVSLLIGRVHFLLVDWLRLASQTDSHGGRGGPGGVGHVLVWPSLNGSGIISI